MRPLILAALLCACQTEEEPQTPRPDAYVPCEVAPELIFDPPVTGNSWFGGDDQPGFGPRSVGAGQEITLAADTRMRGFGLRFGNGFSSSQSGQRGDATLVLDVRDAQGKILAAGVTTVLGSFEGGFVFWEVKLDLTAGTPYTFTAYSVTAFGDQRSASIAVATDDDPRGHDVGGEISSPSEPLEAWSEWGTSALSRDLHWQIRDTNCPPP